MRRPSKGGRQENSRIPEFSSHCLKYGASSANFCFGVVCHQLSIKFCSQLGSKGAFVRVSVPLLGFVPPDTPYVGILVVNSSGQGLPLPVELFAAWHLPCSGVNPSLCVQNWQSGGSYMTMPHCPYEGQPPLQRHPPNPQLFCIGKDTTHVIH